MKTNSGKIFYLTKHTNNNFEITSQDEINFIELALNDLAMITLLLKAFYDYHCLANLAENFKTFDLEGVKLEHQGTDTRPVLPDLAICIHLGYFMNQLATNIFGFSKFGYFLFKLSGSTDYPQPYM